MKFLYKNIQFDIVGFSKDDYIARQITKNNCFYEIDLLEYLLKIKKFYYTDNSVTIDVGANIGNHTIFFRSFLSDHVISVEPNNAVLPALRRNLEQNVDHYTIGQYALGAFEGAGVVTLPKGSEHNVGMAQIVRSPIINSDTIAIVTLDSVWHDWIAKNGVGHDVSLIKIDVEGMELDVLKGARETIFKYRPHILAEAASKTQFLALEALLRSFGYQMLSHWAATPVYHFAYHPSILLQMTVRYLQFLQFYGKIKRKIIAIVSRL